MDENVVDEVILLDNDGNVITSEQFNTAMEELIALEEAQLDALEHTYAMQLFSVVVVAAVAVCLIFHKVIKIFM